VADFLELQPGDVITLDSNVNGNLDVLVGDLLNSVVLPGLRKQECDQNNRSNKKGG